MPPAHSVNVVDSSHGHKHLHWQRLDVHTELTFRALQSTQDRTLTLASSLEVDRSPVASTASLSSKARVLLISVSRALSHSFTPLSATGKGFLKATSSPSLEIMDSAFPGLSFSPKDGKK